MSLRISPVPCDPNLVVDAALVRAGEGGEEEGTRVCVEKRGCCGSGMGKRRGRGFGLYPVHDIVVRLESGLRLWSAASASLPLCRVVSALKWIVGSWRVEGKRGLGGKEGGREGRGGG